MYKIAGKQLCENTKALLYGKRKIQLLPFSGLDNAMITQMIFLTEKFLGTTTVELTARCSTTAAKTSITGNSFTLGTTGLIHPTSVIANSLIGSCTTLRLGSIRMMQSPAGTAPPKRQTSHKELGNKR